jgi:hypothetical protein
VQQDTRHCWGAPDGEVGDLGGVEGSGTIAARVVAEGGEGETEVLELYLRVDARCVRFSTL